MAETRRGIIMDRAGRTKRGRGVPAGPYARSRHVETAQWSEVMAEIRLGIIMHGVTGRMGTNQHLIRSICAIRDQGGVALADGTRVMPDPILVGRSAGQTSAWPERTASHAGPPTWRRHWRTRTTGCLRRGLDPVAPDHPEAGHRRGERHLLRETCRDRTGRGARPLSRGEKAGIRHGVVQDKLWLPGLLKLKMLRDAASSATSCRCAASSATGCSRATGRRRSARAGTTARRTAAASFSTCCATGATCSTTCSAA